MVMISVGRDTGQGTRNRECPAEIGTVVTYEFSALCQCWAVFSA